MGRGCHFGNSSHHSWPTFRIPVPLLSKSQSLLPSCDSESALHNNVSKLLLVRQIQQRTKRWFKRYTISHMKPIHIITDKRGNNRAFSAPKTHMTCRHSHESWMCTICYPVHQAMDGMSPNRSKYPLAIHGFHMTILQTGFKHVPHPY